MKNRAEKPNLLPRNERVFQFTLFEGYRAAEILLETITHPGTAIKTEYCAHTLVKRSPCSKI